MEAGGDSPALTAQVVPMFDTRVLPFDTRAAQALAADRAGATAAGNPLGFADGAIAAIAAAHGFAIAGVDVIDPWAA